jgi:hypothetical protein
VAQVRITHKPNAAAFWRQVGGRYGGPARDVEARGRRVQARAKQLVGVDTGRLRDSIRLVIVPAPGGRGYQARIGTTVAYARVHHEGHGWIHPVRAKILAFRPKGSMRMIFRPRVRPVPGTHFLTRAMSAGRRSTGPF